MLSPDVNRVVKLLSVYSDPERQKLSDWYFPTSMEVIGINASSLKTIVGQQKKELRDLNTGELISYCVDLANAGIFECQQVAYGILNKNYKNRTLRRYTVKSYNQKMN